KADLNQDFQDFYACGAGLESRGNVSSDRTNSGRFPMPPLEAIKTNSRVFGSRPDRLYEVPNSVSIIRRAIPGTPSRAPFCLLIRKQGWRSATTNGCVYRKPHPGC